MIHKTVEIDSTAVFGENIGIGAGTIILPHVFLANDVQIGQNCIIGPNVCIGHAGFGYEQIKDGTWVQKSHNFIVDIEDDVEIGPNTCIGRGSWRNTTVRRGTKIDALVHIAHNVQVGQNCMIVAHAMLAGSVVLEDNVWIGPHACVNQRLTVHEGGFVGTGAVVTKNVPARMVVAGVPAKVLRERRDTDC